jgi:hypothetical protein
MIWANIWECIREPDPVSIPLPEIRFGSMNSGRVLRWSERVCAERKRKLSFSFTLLCLSMMSHRWVREGYRGKWNLYCSEGTFGTCEGDNMRMGLSVIFLVVLILFVFTWFKIWITLVKKIKCPEHSLRILNIVKNIETYVLNVCKV